MKTSELIGPALDWAVAIAKGIPKEEIYSDNWSGLLFRRNRDEEGRLDGTYTTGPALLFSRKWEAGGPIIERMFTEGLELRQGGPSMGNQRCWAKLDSYEYYSHGHTPLIAAMRCYVASKLGDEVDIPAELIKQ